MPRHRINNIFPGHFPFFVGCKSTMLPSFTSFQCVGLAEPLGNFWNFDRNYHTNTVTDKTDGKTSIPCPLPFPKDITVSISTNVGYIYRLKQSVQTKNGSQKSRKFMYRFHPQYFFDIFLFHLPPEVLPSHVLTVGSRVDVRNIADR